jgi:DNA-binding beta-propeller fold protein YncE
VRSIALAAPPDALVLDPSGAPAFVASAGAATVSVLDLARGRVWRAVPIAAPGTLAALALALNPATHHLFVATDLPGPAGVVQMLDGRTGVRLASVPVGQSASALAVDARHRHVLVADNSAGTLTLLDTHSGASLHTIPLGLLPLALAVDVEHNRAFVVGPAASGDPLVDMLTGGTGALVGVLDTRSGRLIDRLPVGSRPQALGLDPRSGRAFVACAGDDTVRVLDTRRGVPLLTVTLDAAPSALAMDARRGRVFVVSAAAGTLSLLDAQTGALLATRRIDPVASAAYARPDALAVDEARDRLYLSTSRPREQGPRGPTLRGNGTLYVLDAVTGALWRRITVRVAPQAIAVEEDSGRVVVVNRGGVVMRLPDGWNEPWLGRLRTWLPWLGRLAPPAPSITRVAGSVSLIDGTP